MNRRQRASTCNVHWGNWSSPRVAARSILFHIIGLEASERRLGVCPFTAYKHDAPRPLLGIRTPHCIRNIEPRFQKLNAKRRNFSRGFSNAQNIERSTYADRHCWKRLYSCTTVRPNSDFHYTHRFLAGFIEWALRSLPRLLRQLPITARIRSLQNLTKFKLVKLQTITNRGNLIKTVQ